MSETSFTFLLVGKTGSGKSALGNTILGTYEFESNDSCQSVTSEYSIKSAFRNGYNLTVIDTPGIMDTRIKSDKKIRTPVENMKHIMCFCPLNGKIAVVIVIKYGDRFTEENKTTVKVLEHIFGKESFATSCLIVMTHGDNFDLEYNGKKSFKDYVKEQNGELGDLLRRSNLKCVLFYNRTKSIVKQSQQFENLIKFAKIQEQTYTKKIFKEAEKEQNRLELDTQLSHLKDNFRLEIQHFSTAIEALDECLDSSKEDKIDVLEHEIDQCISRVNEVDNPDKIYYNSGEKRLLEEIRTELNNLNEKISKMNEVFKQLKTKVYIASEIENIADSINQCKLTDEVNVAKLEECKQQLSNIEKDLHENELSAYNKNEMLAKLEIAMHEIDRKKGEIQKSIETSLQLKMLHLNSRLAYLDPCEEITSGNLHLIREEIEDVTKTLELKEREISKEFMNSIKYMLQNCEDKLCLKAEFLRQSTDRDTLVKLINELSISIRNSKKDLNDENIFNLVLNFKEQFSSLVASVESKKFDEKFTFFLNSSLSNLREELNDLINNVKEHKKKDIDLEIQNIKDGLNNVTLFDDLKQLNDKLNNLKLSLQTDLENLDRQFQETISLTILKLTEDFTKAEERCLNATLYQVLENEIDTIILDIRQAYIKDEYILKVIFRFQEALEHLETKIAMHTHARDLNSKLEKAKRQLQSLIDNVKEVKEEEMILKIQELGLSVNNLDCSDPKASEILSALQKNLSSFKYALEEKTLLSVDDSEYIKITLNHIHTELETHVLKIKQWDKYSEIEIKLKNTEDRINDTVPNDTETNEIIQRIANDLNTITETIVNEQFIKEFNDNLNTKLTEVRTNLEKLKKTGYKK